MTDPILYRDADAGDVGFILSSWLKSAGDAWADSLRNTTIRDWSKLTDTRVGWFADVPHRFTRQAVAEILERATTKSLRLRRRGAIGADCALAARQALDAPQ